jgi:hypothetical protein
MNYGYMTQVKYGMLQRIVLTIITKILLYKYHYIFGRYLFLIVPLLLTLLDMADNRNIFIDIFTKDITNTFLYQKYDKIVDLASYILVLFTIPLTNTQYCLLLGFILYRAIGVLLYIYTKSNIYLVLFFDIIKELFVYIFLFGNNLMYLPLFIIGKIIIEYILHFHINKKLIY